MSSEKKFIVKKLIIAGENRKLSTEKKREKKKSRKWKKVQSINNKFYRQKFRIDNNDGNERYQQCNTVLNIPPLISIIIP